MFNQYDELKRELDAVKRELQKLKDDQIKQNRDYKDTIRNLDADNIPSLQGIVKKVNLIISDGGTVTAQFVMEVVNNESNAKVQADRIDLEGLVLNLTANNITISSDNFSVDKNGHVVMGSAEIKENCILGSDLSTGVGMQIGPDYESNGKSIKTRLVLIEDTDELLDSTTKGVAFETCDRVSDEEAYLSNIESNNHGASVRMYKETYNSRGELDGIDKVGGVSAGRYSSRIEFGDVFLEIDNEGIHYGDSNGNQDLFRKE